jgi:hypothetical protein
MGFLYAGPTVIKDGRVVNLATTPVLGRGYSIATNTFQSTCLSDIKITEPSYDFTYSFQSIRSVTEAELQNEIDMKSFNSDFRNQLIKKITTEGKVTTIDNEVYSNHRMLVVINLHSYYSSVDESNSKVGQSAAILLKKNDLPGFFSSCGSYYVRSIGRTAKFVSIFTYRTRSTTRDTRFENEIETQVKGFSVKKDENIPESAAHIQNQMSFKRRAESYRLTITTAAFGLGKDEKATLISYDPETFKAAIKDAFKSMQNPLTGKVSSIEVVPWVENTDFQALIKLEEDTEVYDEKLKKTRTMLLYEKKHVLNLNAEFFAELERLDRALLNLYYKAKICRGYIDTNWKNSLGLKLEFRDREVLNNRGGARIPLQKLDKDLSNEMIEKILDKEKNFMYGGGAWGKGAWTCMQQIMKQGFFKVSYRDIADCSSIYNKMSLIEDEIVESYCMPVLSIK